MNYIHVNNQRIGGYNDIYPNIDKQVFFDLDKEAS